MHISKIKAACGRIEVMNSSGRVVAIGTGYLIAPDRVATCDHVVSSAELDRIAVRFGSTLIAAEVLERNERTDCALLSLANAPSNSQHLVLGGACEWNAAWYSFGFPSLAKGTGVTIRGLITDPDATDDVDADVLELTSEEAGAGMAAELHGFSGSPIVVGEVVVGHIKRYLADPANPRSAAWGKVYATRASCVWGLLAGAGQADPPPPPVPRPALGTASHAAQLRSVLELLDKSIDDDPVNERVVLAAAESLIQLDEPTEALRYMVGVSASPRADQLRALGLAKIGIPETIQSALSILQTLKNNGGFDAETGGLLGGRFKQFWLLSRDPIYLAKSHETYLDTFEITDHPYPGVNAAATALWLEQKDESQKLAERVLLRLDGVTLDETDFWVLATKGEALLLAGQVPLAKEFYAKALERSDYARGVVKVIRDQAVRNLDALGFDRLDWNDIFEIGS